ncbi:unnamed protein product [Phytomonas sp. Hart1]|nr:unnamed protein product [Phytomonas sp. Hart1]|eukprot:CCW68674.1 unnamed protein product [Phytomonas sp. isolate Hart1]
MPIVEGGSGGIVRQKRGRTSTAEAEARSMLAGSFTIPTGGPIVDMQHSKDTFGVIGMVDSNGRSALMTIAELEKTESGHHRPLHTSSAKSCPHRSFSSCGFDELPSPDAIIARTQTSRISSRAQGFELYPNSGNNAFHSESTNNGGSMRLGNGILNFLVRCTFLHGSCHFVHTQPSHSTYHDDVDSPLFVEPRLGATLKTEFLLTFSSVRSLRAIQRVSWTDTRQNATGLSVVSLMPSQDALLVEMSNGETMFMPFL